MTTISRQKANSLGRKIHQGKQGGRYVVIKGSRRYIGTVPRSKKSSSTSRKKTSSKRRRKSSSSKRRTRRR